ncbi:MAG: bifunctional folylpolyglutamate synthase/dihydrofolate synthase [Acidobacteria bacterium]|nr:bifunctional folylpolyglutamate synthase/dihydrofolate synthase [Acidobacteriota bacterium]
MRFREAVARLDARTNYEATGRLVAPTLERMRALAGLLANPSLPAIHVTGTNGKTTCARAATEVLRAAGLAVGTYTSPHLHSPTERIAFDGVPISEDEFASTLEYLEPFLAEVDRLGSRVTWFEAVTAMALVFFADKAVDGAVIEVGMGGDWDATNVVDAQVAVITEVTLDHPELGATPTEIAREKAGIVKDGAIVLTAERDPEVLAVIERRCRERGAELRVAREVPALGARAEGGSRAAVVIEERLLAVGGQRLEIRIGDRRYEDLLLPLYGSGLALDAALGTAAAVAFLGDRDLADEAMSEAFSGMRSPGRVEVARREPLVVLDGAHNPRAAASVAEAMLESFHWDDLTLVAGMLGDKDVAGVLAALAPLAGEIVVAPVASPRSAPPERLRDALGALGRSATIARSVPEAVERAIASSGARDCVLVAGSLYTVGEARQSLARENRESR